MLSDVSQCKRSAAMMMDVGPHVPYFQGRPHPFHDVFWNYNHYQVIAVIYCCIHRWKDVEECDVGEQFLVELRSDPRTCLCL